MKFNALSLGFVAGAAIASPTPTTNENANVAQIAKRASITDVSRISGDLLKSRADNRS